MQTNEFYHSPLIFSKAYNRTEETTRTARVDIQPPMLAIMIQFSWRSQVRCQSSKGRNMVCTSIENDQEQSSDFVSPICLSIVQSRLYQAAHRMNNRIIFEHNSSSTVDDVSPWRHFIDNMFFLLAKPRLSEFKF